MSEIAGRRALIVHALTGCNLNCYQCLNRDMLHEPGIVSYSIDDVTKYIELNKDLVDCVVLSGDEYLQGDIRDVESDLREIRSLLPLGGIIIIYTNGTHPNEMVWLMDMGLVDGFHVDMKLPYHLLLPDKEDGELVKEVLGVKYSPEMITDMLNAIHYAVSYDKGFNQIRSVKYPLLPESAFEVCESYIRYLRRIYKKSTPYEVHPFVSKDEIEEE